MLSQRQRVADTLRAICSIDGAKERSKFSGGSGQSIHATIEINDNAVADALSFELFVGFQHAVCRHRPAKGPSNEERSGYLT